MAEINFTCSNCSQLLSADETYVGQEITCPSCNASITVEEQAAEASGSGESPMPARLTVQSGTGDATLIQKPARTLDISAKEAVKVRCKTFRHHDHVKGDKDTFDEAVSRFLDETGETNVMSVESIQYTWIDKESKTPMTDYGAMVIYKGL